jgi:hypothetical protein
LSHPSQKHAYNIKLGKIVLKKTVGDIAIYTPIGTSTLIFFFSYQNHQVIDFLQRKSSQLSSFCGLTSNHPMAR